jgi:ribosomal protein S14
LLNIAGAPAALPLRPHQIERQEADTDDEEEDFEEEEEEAEEEIEEEEEEEDDDDDEREQEEEVVQDEQEQRLLVLVAEAQHQAEPEAAQAEPSTAGKAAKQCSHCGSLQAGPTGTYSWRRHPTTEASLCGPCRRYADKHGGELRPLTGKKQQQQQEEEQQEEEDQEEEEQQQVVPATAGQAAKQCSHCGSLQPGPTATYAWRRHPTTDAPLCGPCRRYADKHGGELRPLAGSDRSLHPTVPPPTAATKRQSPRQAGKAAGFRSGLGVGQATDAAKRQSTAGRHRAAGRAAKPAGSSTLGRRQEEEEAQQEQQQTGARKRLRQSHGALAAAAQLQPLQHQQVPADLLDVLLMAADQPAAAAVGLTAGLVVSFWWEVVQSLPAQRRAELVSGCWCVCVALPAHQQQLRNS